MPLIARIGRKSIGPRLLIAGLYIILSIGAITMIYPFLLMLSGSTKGAVDSNDLDVIPRFVLDENDLYARHLEGMFNENFPMMQWVYGMNVPTFRDIPRGKNPNIAFISEYEKFLSNRDFPAAYYDAGYINATREALPHNMRRIKRIFMDRYENDVDRFNSAAGGAIMTWNQFRVTGTSGTGTAVYLRLLNPASNLVTTEYNKFKYREPFAARVYYSIENHYRVGFLQQQYSADISKYNKAHGTAYTSYSQIPLNPRHPGAGTFTELQREDWRIYVKTILSIAWIRFDNGARAAYHNYLTAKYRTVENVNKNYGARYGSIREVDFPKDFYTEIFNTTLRGSDLNAFVRGWKDPDGTLHEPPLESLSVHCIDFDFRDHLRNSFGSVAEMNRVLGTSFQEFAEVQMPQKEMHERYFEANKGFLRIEFLTRNYIRVFEEVIMQGRAVFNTVIFCLLSIISALIINPLAAYALSRYNIRSKYIILLLSHAYDGVPAYRYADTAVHSMRNFNMLNTFWALILPGVANGYSIFLLKGFFDSLPKELYESAQIDGAIELQLFWHITMSLSTPILAVIALNAFTHAYGAFMYALLICQDRDMWTLMVFLYNLQRSSGPGVMFASLLVAAIPTLIVFVFAQNVIMRGIVVPSEK